VGVRHLLNVKTVAERRETMQWFRVPQKLYFKRGCLPIALQELRDVLGAKRVFVVTDANLLRHGQTACVTDRLHEMGIPYQVYAEVAPDPTLACVQAGAAQMRQYAPDVVLALGGGSAMDAAKIMWVLYEHPEVSFQDLAMRFADIRKRIVPFPALGEKAHFVAVPTTSGTGSEVTPFAVITDAETGIKYPLADYALLPHMAIVDADLMMGQPPALTAAAGMDALIHALEAYVSVMATAYTDGLALQAMGDIFRALPVCYADGNHLAARETMAHAATIAGMAFANAFLGLCHAMAHQLGAFHHLPHGVANALLIPEIMRWNAVDAPQKMGSFPQYAYPCARTRYCTCARWIGITGDSEEEIFHRFVEKIEALRSSVGIHSSVRAYGVTEEAYRETLDKMTEQAFDDQCVGANPRYPLQKEIREIYLRIYDGV
jgi:acetaldehyde dehydrogenase/alcohol dehydrogenase